MKDREFRKLEAINDDRRVKVLRSGNAAELSVYDIVVGDVVLLSTGDFVPGTCSYVCVCVFVCVFRVAPKLFCVFVFFFSLSLSLICARVRCQRSGHARVGLVLARN